MALLSGTEVVQGEEPAVPGVVGTHDPLNAPPSPDRLSAQKAPSPAPEPTAQSLSDMQVPPAGTEPVPNPTNTQPPPSLDAPLLLPLPPPLEEPELEDEDASGLPLPVDELLLEQATAATAAHSRSTVADWACILSTLSEKRG